MEIEISWRYFKYLVMYRIHGHDLFPSSQTAQWSFSHPTYASFFLFLFSSFALNQCFLLSSSTWTQHTTFSFFLSFPYFIFSFFLSFFLTSVSLLLVSSLSSFLFYPFILSFFFMLVSSLGFFFLSFFLLHVVMVEMANAQ